MVQFVTPTSGAGAGSTLPAAEGSRSLSAMEFVERVADAGTWTVLELHQSRRIPQEYAKQLRRARERSGQSESIITGTAKIQDEPVVLVVSEFSFMGGTIGHEAADRVAHAITFATTHRLPLVLAPRSGGTRMQEGSSGFARMIDLVRALQDHRAAGLISLAYLRNPTTGGVLASWGSLTSLTYAERGALVGFLGPKVFAQLRDAPFPSGVQTSENLAARGLIDGVVDVEDFRTTCASAARLSRNSDRRGGSKGDRGGAPGAPIREQDSANSPLPAVSAARNNRPSTLSGSVIAACEDVVTARGDGAGSINTGAELVLARTRDLPIVMFAMGTNPEDPETSVADLLLARRGMRLAEDLRLPFVSIVDTPGAELSPDAENRGLAREISRCMCDMAALSVPSVSVLLDRGCGGAALALLGGRARIALDRAWLAPLPLPGASVLMFGDPSQAHKAASLQRVRAVQLREDGVVNLVIGSQMPDQDVSSVLDAVCAAITAQADEIGPIPC